MLNNKKIAEAETQEEDLSYPDLLKAFASKDHYQIRLAIFDISFLNNFDQNYLASSPAFRNSTKESLISLNKIGDIISIKLLNKIMKFSAAELKELSLTNSAIEGVRTLSAYGYFADVLKLISIYNIPLKILQQNDIQQNAFLGLVALKNQRVKKQPAVSTIIEKYQLPKITIEEWQVYTKQYFLMELSDPLIYKGYDSEENNLENWQTFLHNCGSDNKPIDNNEITAAAITGVKKVYSIGQRKRAAQLIIYFSLWEIEELAEIIKDVKPIIDSITFTYKSINGIELNLIKKSPNKPIINLKINNHYRKLIKS